MASCTVISSCTLGGGSEYKYYLHSLLEYHWNRRIGVQQTNKTSCEWKWWKDASLVNKIFQQI